MPNHTNMKRLTRATLDGLRRLPSDEDGGELLEYALIAALCVIACIGIIASVGQKLIPLWQGLGDEWTSAGVDTASTAGSSSDTDG